MSEVVKINFDKDLLYGFERPKSVEVIESLIKSIKMRIELPLFSVYQLGNNMYSLSPDEKIEINGEYFIDGGHHRSIAFLREKRFLYANLVEKPNIPHHMLQLGYLNIKDIPVISMPDEYIKRKNRYGNYL
ncbi:MAG: hypothetical protein PHS49_06550 [Candidatus Gracilibacteria bacterium]|nr:hypothetical protein [Candidatus Gracilibacteria bacterium]